MRLLVFWAVVSNASDALIRSDADTLARLLLMSKAPRYSGVRRTSVPPVLQSVLEKSDPAALVIDEERTTEHVPETKVLSEDAQLHGVVIPGGISQPVAAANAASSLDVGLDDIYSMSSAVTMERLKAQPVDNIIGQWLKSIDPKLLRLWTKADFLHAHAVSGVVFLLFGTIWQILRVIDVWAGGDANGLLASDGALSATFAVAGLINAITAIPMSQFASNKVFDITDLKGNGFALGGTGLTTMCLWLAWWFSGSYPEAWHAADAALVGLSSFLCIATTVNWEVMLQKNLSGEDNEHGREPKKREKRNRQDRKLIDHKGVSAQTLATKRWLYRIASWPNLTQILFMSSIALGGAAWLQAVLDVYPDQGRVLFDYSFASALGYSLSMFAETLRDRKLIGLQADFVALLVGVIGPMLIVALDVFGSQHGATIVPAKYWYIFAGLPK